MSHHFRQDLGLRISSSSVYWMITFVVFIVLLPVAFGRRSVDVSVCPQTIFMEMFSANLRVPHECQTAPAAQEKP